MPISVSQGSLSKRRDPMRKLAPSEPRIIFRVILEMLAD
jgi:hypothetical protein